MSSRPHIGPRIAALRKARNMSQGELAAAIDMHQPRLSRIEAGRIEIRLSEALDISQVLAVPVGEIATGETDEAAAHRMRVERQLEDLLHTLTKFQDSLRAMRDALNLPEGDDIP
ncbi:helix-turn-helix domain-containing protein [Nesterenkonia aurantiaca]|uniref:helix-turn-helix domain-containing protein n=1 Tax=Nesterenkonia aurantiaca TaxID=1436010 RepID=UPI003EE6A279